MSTHFQQTDAIAGAILACAVGDAIGLPYEGLSRHRGIRLMGEPDRQRFIFGRDHQAPVGRSEMEVVAGE